VLRDTERLIVAWHRVCENPANTEMRLSDGFGEKSGRDDLSSSNMHHQMHHERIDARIFLAVIA
jgi:hypothetical protein